MTRRLTIVAHEIGAWANHRADTARLARQAGWDVTLVMGGKGDPVPLAAGEMPDHLSLPMARGVSGPRDLVGSVLMMRRMMRRSDVVELVTLKPIVVGMLAWRTLRPRRRPRVVATFAGLGTVLDASTAATTAPSGKAPWLVVLMRSLLRDHATVLVENPDDAASLVQSKIIGAHDIVVGPGVGLPAEWLALPANQPGPTGLTFTIVYVGRLIASKGVVDLVAALRLLRGRGVRVRTLLAGALDDRNPSAVSAAEVQQWHDEGLVEWLGHVADPTTVYRSADIVVLASHREGRPRSLMEAQALGIPVVATDVPGCRQVLDPGVTGVLVPAHDPQALADAIEALVHDPARRAELGHHGRIWAHEQFGAERFLDVWAATVLGDG